MSKTENARTKRNEPRDRSLEIIPVSYNSVSEMLHATTDPAFAEEFDARQNARKLGQALMILRMMNTITQAEMAEKLACTQSKVSKLERGRDIDHLLGDIVAFARALGKGVRLVVEDGEGLVVEVEGSLEATGRKRVTKK